MSTVKLSSVINCVMNRTLVRTLVRSTVSSDNLTWYLEGVLILQSNKDLYTTRLVQVNLTFHFQNHNAIPMSKSKPSKVTILIIGNWLQAHVVCLEFWTRSRQHAFVLPSKVAWASTIYVCVQSYIGRVTQLASCSHATALQLEVVWSTTGWLTNT